MSGMFQRIARRHADLPEQTEAPGGPTAAEATSSTVAAPPSDAQPQASDEQATAVTQPAAEQPTVHQPAMNVPPPVIALGAPPATSEHAPVAPGPVPAAADATPATAETAVMPAETAPRRPGFRARGRLRRRLRYLRKLRELQVRDLGGLMFDLRRFERKRDDLVAQKIDHIRACDDELRALEQALAERRDLRDVREPGVGGTCPRCFAVFGSADRFCASCGAALGGAVQGPAQVPPAPVPAAAPPSAPPPPQQGASGPRQ